MRKKRALSYIGQFHVAEEPERRSDFNDPPARIKLEDIPAKERRARTGMMVGMPEFAAGEDGKSVPEAMQWKISRPPRFQRISHVVLCESADDVAKRVDAPRKVET